MKSHVIGIASRSNRKEELKHHVRAVQEFELNGGEVEFPHAAETLVSRKASKQADLVQLTGIRA